MILVVKFYMHCCHNLLLINKNVNIRLDELTGISHRRFLKLHEQSCHPNREPSVQPVPWVSFFVFPLSRQIPFLLVFPSLHFLFMALVVHLHFRKTLCFKYLYDCTVENNLVLHRLENWRGRCTTQLLYFRRKYVPL